ncbi:MAG TPA: hypothetical protein VJT74_16380 [Pyrinomonadaceae bacterium]|nr:hypothetical protein [Pyrinomonadaceae bacterium]
MASDITVSVRTDLKIHLNVAGEIAIAPPVGLVISARSSYGVIADEEDDYSPRLNQPPLPVDAYAHAKSEPHFFEETLKYIYRSDDS